MHVADINAFQYISKLHICILWKADAIHTAKGKGRNTQLAWLANPNPNLTNPNPNPTNPTHG